MFDKLSPLKEKTTNHVTRCRGRYAAAAGFIAGAATMRKLDHHSVNVIVAFLEDRGLKDEFLDSVKHEI